MTAFLTWLFGTRIGRIFFTAFIVAWCWYGFSSYYYRQGVKDCQAQRLDDTNAANVEQGNKNIDSNKIGSEIGKRSDEAGAKVATEAEASNQQSKEIVHVVYKNPPVTAPIAVGSCVHPLDERVQSRISEARAAAAEARAAAR